LAHTWTPAFQVPASALVSHEPGSKVKVFEHVEVVALKATQSAEVVSSFGRT